MCECFIPGVIFFLLVSVLFNLLRDWHMDTWKGIILRKTVIVELFIFILSALIVFIAILIHDNDVLELYTEKGTQYKVGQNGVTDISNTSSKREPNQYTIEFDDQNRRVVISFDDVAKVVYNDGDVTEYKDE